MRASLALWFSLVFLAFFGACGARQHPQSGMMRFEEKAHAAMLHAPDRKVEDVPVVDPPAPIVEASSEPAIAIPASAAVSPPVSIEPPRSTPSRVSTREPRVVIERPVAAHAGVAKEKMHRTRVAAVVVPRPARDQDVAVPPPPRPVVKDIPVPKRPRDRIAGVQQQTSRIQPDAHPPSSTPSVVVPDTRTQPSPPKTRVDTPAAPMIGVVDSLQSSATHALPQQVPPAPVPRITKPQLAINSHASHRTPPASKHRRFKAQPSATYVRIYRVSVLGAAFIFLLVVGIRILRRSAGNSFVADNVPEDLTPRQSFSHDSDPATRPPLDTPQLPPQPFVTNEPQVAVPAPPSVSVPFAPEVPPPDPPRYLAEGSGPHMRFASAEPPPPSLKPVTGEFLAVEHPPSTREADPPKIAQKAFN